MSDAQFQKIAGFIAGLETALVHIGNVLERQGVTTRADLAAGFRETADLLPEGAMNREVISFFLKHLADGTEGTGLATSPPAADPAPFLRVIEGGKTPES